ncbi:MAG: MFS transporter [Elusimicrobia bacterium]|nr:MFS transporter [Elusimicrobiota bacterium]
MELSLRDKTLASAGVILGIFLAAIESTAVATAMPSATSALGGIGLIHYVFAAYSLATVTTIMIWGKLADIWGLKRSFMVGCSIFLFGSALCGISTHVYELITFRFIQGIGAGAIFPVAMTTLGAIHTEVKRAKMQIYLSMVWAIASVMGPPVGALVTHHLSWHWVFYLNLPAGLVALGLVSAGLRGYIDGDALEKRTFDTKGSMILSLAIFSLLAAIAVDRNGRLIMGWPGMLILAATAFGFLVLFGRHILTTRHPFVAEHILKNTIFIRAGASNFFMCMAMFGSFAYVPLFCQAGLGETVAGAGRTLTVSMFGWITSSAFATRAYLRYSLRTLSRMGIAVMTLAFAYLASHLNGISVTAFRVSMFAMGSGMGICFAPMLLGLQSALPRRDLGAGTASLQLLRNLGGLMGVAVMGTLLALYWDKSRFVAGAAPLLETQLMARQAMSKVFLVDTLIALAGLLSAWGLPSLVPKREAVTAPVAL